MEVNLRGLGDAQSDCNRLKDPAVNGGICTAQDLVAFATWQTGVNADIARHNAADATNPATAMVGLLAWASPSIQLDMLFNHTPRPPLLYYVGAALPFVALYLLLGGKGK
jgi:hypothetical protein